MVSVVIPAFNEEALLPQCLAALAAQQEAPPFEVILVDNSSTDQTSLMAEPFRAVLNLRVVVEPRRGRGQARATGFAAARGEWLLSTDADALVPPTWVAHLSAALKDHAVVTGPARIADCSSAANAFFNTVFWLTVKVYRLLFGSVWLGGYNFGIRRSLYQAVGEFNPALNAMEDVELGARVVKKIRIQYLPGAGVVFSGRRFQRGVVAGLWSYWVQFCRYRRGHYTQVRLTDAR